MSDGIEVRWPRSRGFVLGAAFAWLGGAAGAHVEPEVRAEESAFVEVVTSSDTYFVSEPVLLRLRFGFDANFLRDNLVQLFRRNLDVPAQVLVGELDLLSKSTASEQEEGTGTRLSFALNDGVALASKREDVVRNGRPFVVLEFERRFLPDRAGEWVLPSPRLRFAFATRFRDDFISGRVAEDRRDASVSGEALRLFIRELPEQGRPEGFGGAVGRYTVRAEASPRQLGVGESLELVLTIDGAGNLEQFGSPSLADLDGFHVRGRIEEKLATRRVLTYDLVPLGSDVEAIPPIAFAYFDPDAPAGYREVRTVAIPLSVTGPERDARPEVPAELDILDLKQAHSPTRTGDDASLSFARVLSVLMWPWLFGAGLLVWLRARERALGDPLGVRARAAAAAFRSRSARADGDLGEAFAEYLAARLRCSPPAVIGPGLAERLTNFGVPPERAARAATLLFDLVAERYGGRDTGEDRQTVFELVDELEDSLRAVGREA